MYNSNFRKVLFNVDTLIEKWFKDKKDKGGHPYINHLYAVAANVDKEIKRKVVDNRSSLAIFYRKAYIVSLLHDILEDTECTEQELRDAGCDDEIIYAIKAITRNKNGQYYFDFIQRVSNNDIARIVKIYDLEDNMDIKRLIKLDDNDLKRIKKYWYCWKYLKREISEIECNNTIHPDRLFR